MKTKTLEEEIIELKEEISERDEKILGLQDEIKDLEDTIEELQDNIESFEETLSYQSELPGVEVIKYQDNGNIIDQQLMSVFSEALQKMTPLQLIEKLKC